MLIASKICWRFFIVILIYDFRIINDDILYIEGF